MNFLTPIVSAFINKSFIISIISLTVSVITFLSVYYNTELDFVIICLWSLLAFLITFILTKFTRMIIQHIKRKINNKNDLLKQIQNIENNFFNMTDDFNTSEIKVIEHLINKNNAPYVLTKNEQSLYYNHNYPKIFRFQKNQKFSISSYLPDYEIKVCFTEEGFEIAKFIYDKYKKISRFE